MPEHRIAAASREERSCFSRKNFSAQTTKPLFTKTIAEYWSSAAGTKDDAHDSSKPAAFEA